MAEFIIEEYYEKYQKKTYLDVFFDFLKDKFESDKIDDEYFTLVNEADLLESLDYFILARKVTARSTASAYIGKLRTLFKDLEKDYGITNDIFINGNFMPMFDEKVKNRISVLNETIDKNLATDEQYNAVVDAIIDFDNEYSYEKVVEGIDQYLVENSVNASLRPFRKLCSICATQLVIEYGLKNNVIRDIKLTDIDLTNNIIKRGKYSIPLSKMLRKNIERYIQIRDYILLNTKRTQEWLFINYTGESFHKTYYAENLFYLLASLNNDANETDPYARRVLIKMIEKGFNAEMICDITGYKDTVYKNVCAIVNNNDNQVNEKLGGFVNEVDLHKENIAKKGYINCPICGKSVKAVSSELVLIKKKNDDALYLACKNCGGHNGW